jgi:tripartite-type tricarboxylate transporter receptor subunit TctC
MKMKMACLLCLLVLSAAVPVTETQAAPPYFEGKTITMIVGFSAGGGYDRMTRILARNLPKYIPGKPTIVVQNMPGAGSMVAANTLFNLTKPDGLTIGIFNRGLVFAQLLKAQGVQFDLRKFAWVGSASVETATLALRADLPFKTVDDLLKVKTPIPIGSAGGPGDSATQFIVLLREFAKIPIKIVDYQASPETMLALEQKEVDGRGGAYTSFKPFLERGLIRLWIRGRVSVPEIETLALDEDLTTDKIGKTIMAMRSAPDSMGKAYAAPPGTPAELMNILTDALAKTVNDPETISDARKSLMEVAFVPPKECLRLFSYVLDQPQDVVKEVGKYIKF